MYETPIFHYYNDGTRLGMVKYDSAVHEEDLNGSDKLTITSEQLLWKRDRLLWQDSSGEWHEHIVDHSMGGHHGKRQVVTHECSNSISELFGVECQGTVYDGDVGYVLRNILEGTRWDTDKCSKFGTVRIEVWHKSVRQCLSELVDACQGELYTKITLDESGDGISRRIGIVKERGSQRVLRQFTYGRNVSKIDRDVGADEVYTAITGYGAKLDEDGVWEYDERLSVTLTDSTADLRRWGVNTPNGQLTHYKMIYTDDACTDLQFLATQCQRQLDVMSKPLVHYQFDAVDVMEDTWSDIRLGNRVMCIDDYFDPPIQLVERISHIKRNLRGRVSCIVSIGKRINPMVERFKATEKVTRQASGNTTRSYNRSPTPPVSSGGLGGDGWVHQIDGVTHKSGTINFTTVAVDDPADTLDFDTTTWGGNKTNKGTYTEGKSNPAGGGGLFSGGGGGGVGGKQWGGTGHSGGGAF